MGLVLARAKREAHRQTDTGAFSDQSWRESIADGWDIAWGLLTQSGDDLFGRAKRTFTIAVASPVQVLPEAFMELDSLTRITAGCNWTPARVSPKAVETKQLDKLTTLGHSGGAYVLEGTAIEFSESLAMDVVRPQQIRFFPPLAVGEEIRIGYVSQAPSMGDASDPASDDIVVDFIRESIARTVVGYARAIAAGREDSKELLRAQSDLEAAVTAIVEARSRHDQNQPWDARMYT